MKCYHCKTIFDYDGDSSYWENDDGNFFCSEPCLDATDNARAEESHDWYCPQCDGGFPDSHDGVIYNNAHYCSERCVDEKKADE